MASTTIKRKTSINTIEIEVEYTHHPAIKGSHTEKPESAYVEIEKVSYLGTDVTRLIEAITPYFFEEAQLEIEGKL